MLEVSRRLFTSGASTHIEGMLKGSSRSNSPVLLRVLLTHMHTQTSPSHTHSPPCGCCLCRNTLCLCTLTIPAVPPAALLVLFL